MEWRAAEGARLMVWAWYPAQGTPRLEPVWPASWADKRRAVLSRRLGAQAAEAMTGVREWRLTDAPLARSSSPFPVLIFSPGLSWLPPDYSALAASLASRGLIVFGVAAPGFAGPLVYPDGTVSEQTLGPADQAVWEQSIRFAAARLRTLNHDSASPFCRRLDLSRLGLFGHSLGGAASMAVAADTPEVSAAANLDGDFMGAAREVRPAQPLLLLSFAPGSRDGLPLLERMGLERSERRRSSDWLSVASRSASAQRYFLDGASHLDVLDAALAAGDLIPERLRANRFGPSPAGRTLAAAAALLDAFFRRTPLAAAAAAHPALRPAP